MKRSKLLDHVREVIRTNQFSYGTEKTRIGRRLPVVFSRDETRAVLSNLQGECHLMASLLYGSGLRLSECMKLRTKDADFKLNEIVVRGGKGDSDRRTLLQKILIPHSYKKK